MRGCSWPVCLLLALTQCRTAKCYGFGDGRCGTTMGATSADAGKLARLKQQYSGCEKVVGNLVLANFKNETYDDLSFLNSVKEITGYLKVVGNSELQRLPLANLSIIRGMQTICGKSVYIAANGKMTGLFLDNLVEIQAGSVDIHDNWNLCYYNSINWAKLTRENVRTFNNSATCNESCSGCANSLCWGRSSNGAHCQIVHECNGCRRCFGPSASQCCDEECAVGCSTNSAKSCTLCRNARKNGECVETCAGTKTPGWAEYDFRYRQEDECVAKCSPGFVQHDGMCLTLCPDKYSNVSSVCQYCGNYCEKRCVVSGFLRGRRKLDDSEICKDTPANSNIDELRNCTTLEGNLDILSGSFSSLEDYEALNIEDLQVLKSVKKVTGKVFIELPEKSTLKSLDFLSNLETIGSEMNESLKIYDYSGNLTALNLRRLKYIEGPKLEFCTKTCRQKSVKWRKLTTPNAKLIVCNDKQRKEYFNSTSCEEKISCDVLCNADYGCWGTGNDMCVRCAQGAFYHAQSHQCVANCSQLADTYVFTSNDSSGVVRECRQCHPECAPATGCWGAQAHNCVRCKNARLSNGSCVSNCPPRSAFLQRQAQSDSNVHTNASNSSANANSDCKLELWTPKCASDCSQCKSLAVCTRCTIGRSVDRFARLSWSNTDAEVRQVIERASCLSNNTCPPNYWSFNASGHLSPISASNESNLQFGHANASKSWSARLGRLLQNYSQEVICLPCDVCRDCVDARAQCAAAYTLADSSALTHALLQHLPLVGTLTVLASALVAASVTWWRRKAKAVQRSRGVALELLAGSVGDKANLTLRVLSKSEISLASASEAKSGALIGAGSFGQVMRATWHPRGRKTVVVDVVCKRLRCNAETSLNQRTLLRMFKKLASFSHTHCVWIIGVVLDAQHIEVVTQFAPLGCVRDYVAAHGQALTAQQLLSWMHQIAQGMAQLETLDIVHRSLAARNVLLYNAHLVKVADYGLAELFHTLDDVQAVCDAHADANTRWLAYECLANGAGAFSSKSDVWSFGVTLWEICQFGGVPYSQLASGEIHAWLQKGERLCQPSTCTIDVYVLLLRCWMLEPSCRPSFTDLVGFFSRMTKEPSRYLCLAAHAYNAQPSEKEDVLLQSDVDDQQQEDAMGSNSKLAEFEKCTVYYKADDSVALAYGSCTVAQRSTTNDYISIRADTPELMPCKSKDSSDTFSRDKVSFQHNSRARSYSELKEIPSNSARRSFLNTFKSVLLLRNPLES